jgi:3-dehydroquinate synthetase
MKKTEDTPSFELWSYIGHVKERQYKLPHGQSVILGMLIAMKISIEMNELSEEVI